MDSKSASLPTTQRIWVLNNFAQGEPGPEDAILVERPLEADKMVRGEVLVKTTHMSVDPYMRGMFNPGKSYAGQYEKGTPLAGGAVGVVVKSLHADFKEGDVVSGQFSWRDYVILHGSELKQVPKDRPPSYSLGVLGMPGATAYYSFFQLCEPRPKETVFISGAAGAVGSLVGQLAKSIGCTVIGSAGGAKKVEYCKGLGFDHCIDYRGKDREAVIAELKEVAPNGIDVYFDNTGGPVTEAAFLSLNSFARVAVCGQIHHYNKGLAMAQATGLDILPLVLFKQVKVTGFLVWQFQNWEKAHDAIWKLIQDKKIRVDESVVEGLENAYEAFRNMLKGANIGKQVVKLA